MSFSDKFVCASNEYNTVEKNVPAPYMRRTFSLAEQSELAKLVICGLGYYELHVNGRNITNGYFRPYRSNLDDYVYYDEYDIAPYVHTGKNVIAVILGNGFLNPLSHTWDFCKAHWRGAPRLAFSLEIKKIGCEDCEVITADENVLTAPSPVLFDDLHFGEFYDARCEIPGWDTEDFDDSGWKNTIPACASSGTPRFCEAEPVIVRKERKPVSVTACDNGYLYDFGINDAGLYRLKIAGSAGQKVHMIFGEAIVDGSLFVKNIRFNATDDKYQEDIYYCKGGCTEEYTPRFTYHGYRYIFVKGITAEQATEDLFTYLVMSSDLESIGEFSCSDETINKLQEITRRSDLSNFFFVPTDCPHREKNGWTADAALSCEQALLNFKPEVSYREWMRNICKSLTDEGQLPGIIPTPGWGYQWGNGPAWDCVIVYLPYYTYMYRGDISTFSESSHAIMRYLNYLYSRLDENDLMHIGLGDWCQVGRNESNYDAPIEVTDTIMTYDIAKKAELLFRAAGQQPQMLFAQTLAQRSRAAFRKFLIDPDTLIVKGDCQTSQAMALYYKMFEPDEESTAFKYLLKQIEKADGHFDTGVLGGRIIFRLLADNDEAELAYNMIVRPDYPSYGNLIVRGATTLWEKFMPEGAGFASLNHHFWGDISAWFYIYLAGIRVNPCCDNPARLDIAPCFIEKLDFVKAVHKTASGKICVNWRRSNNGITLDITVPDSFSGEIRLPHGYVFTDGKNVLPLRNGSYNIVFE